MRVDGSILGIAVTGDEQVLLVEYARLRSIEVGPSMGCEEACKIMRRQADILVELFVRFGTIVRSEPYRRVECAYQQCPEPDECQANDACGYPQRKTGVT